MPILHKRSLSGLLRGSPFKPIQEHMRVVFSCVCHIPALFDAVFREDSHQVIEIAQHIKDEETHADRLKAAFRLSLPRSLLLPVDRKDLLSLIGDQDKIADTAENIAKTFLFRDMMVPEGIKDLLDELLEGTMEIAGTTKQMIEELDELLEVGFSGRELDKVNLMIAGVRRSEHNIDDIIHRIRRKVFTLEKGLDPVSVMFWYQIIDLVGAISDLSENLADRLLLFISQ